MRGYPFISTLLLLSIIVTSWPEFWMTTVQAAPAGTLIEYEFAGDKQKDHEYGGRLFSKDIKKNTNRVTVTAGSGQIIKSLKIYDRNGTFIRNVKGFTPRKSYTFVETFSGTKMKVESLGNTHAGSIYYWDRSGGSDVWRATSSDFIAYSNVADNGNGITCLPNSQVPKDKWNRRAYPGCTDTGNLSAPIKIKNFVIPEGEFLANAYQLPMRVVSDRAGELVAKAEVDMKTEIPVAVHGTSCKSDTSTEYTKIGAVNSLNGIITLKYKQTFGEESITKGQYKDWASPGARQMWYCGKFNVDFHSYTYMYHDKVIYAEFEQGTTNVGGGNCVAEILPPTQGAVQTRSHMNPNPTAQIGADARGSERFNVTQGIPTTESLYANVRASEYLFDYTFANMNGNVRYTCQFDIVYDRQWKEQHPDICDDQGCEPQDPTDVTDQLSVSYSFTFDRQYSYWTIKHLEAYGLSRSDLYNYALPGGAIMLYATGYSEPELLADRSDNVEDHVTPAETGAVTYTDTSLKSEGMTPPEPPAQATVIAALKAMAEAATDDPKVKNDWVEFNGTVVMDNSERASTGPTPGAIPQPAVIGPDVLYRSGLFITSTLRNAANTPSTGTIYYEPLPDSLDGYREKEFSIAGINSVTVHTPVVNYSTLPDDNRPFDQRMNPDLSRTVLVLDRPFTIRFNESGQHRSIQGYGNRDYIRYTQQKRVRFPFGVFQGSTYYAANTWIDYPVGVSAMTFTMPTWVDEGNYQIRTESWAINSEIGDSCELNRNSSLANYCAYETFDVGVVGRLYGFRVWDIGDPRYETVFRTAKGSKQHKPVAYYSGGRDENGVPTALEEQYNWLLPIRQGSHPTQQATVPHNGYAFLFDFKTIGNLWNSGEGIRIDPTFWFVPRSGGEAIEVDLYYDASGAGNKMIAVGSELDRRSYTRMYTLADPFRNIATTELQEAANYEYHHILTANERAKQPWSRFYSQYLERKVPIGIGYKSLILPYKSRTLIGTSTPPAAVNPTVALRSEQHWYGEYHLPIAPYILPKGTNLQEVANKYGGKLNGHESEFLKKGYIIVNFQLYTVKNNDPDTRILGYKGRIANMWEIEGQVSSARNYLGQTFQYHSGDIILFESDYSVRNDFQGQGK
ncbi:DUF5704 domain-containing protein [Paenibacillus septentrionalis]